MQSRATETATIDVAAHATSPRCPLALAPLLDAHAARPHVERVALHTHHTSIRFQDVDAAGIMFFARIFDLFHDAYVAHLRARGVKLEEVLKAKTWGAPLVHVEADYARPLSFADEIAIDVELDTLGDTSITVRYAVRRGADVCARGLTKHVFIDRATGRPRPLPDEIVAAFADLLPRA